MQAPKNGFFYILDRKTGELLSAAKFADTVTWAKGIDPNAGRPMEVEGQRYAKAMAVVAPTNLGAHNWQTTHDGRNLGARLAIPDDGDGPRNAA